MNAPRHQALSATVVPLPSAQRGLEAELVLRLPSDVGLIEEAVELVARHLEAAFVDRHTIRFNLRVALCEALANAILYGNRSDPSKDVSIRVLFGRTAIEMEVSDEGDGFAPDDVPDPTTAEHLADPDGRGIFLIQRLVDEVRFNEKGNTICMILRRA